MIITRTPFRVSFFGGGTDYPAWYQRHGGVVLATSIDKYCYISCRYLPPFFDHKYRIVYSRIENTKSISEIQHPAVKAVLDTYGCHDGLEIHHDGDLPARAGLGSSSSFTVGLINAVMALRGKYVSREELASQAIHVEQNVIQENVGSQDQITAAFGGFNRIEFRRDNSFDVAPVILPPEKLASLRGHLMLCFTGLSRIASEVAKSQIDNIDKREKELQFMKGLVDQAITVLQSRTDSIEEFGHLLHQSWMYKRQLSDQVSNSEIDNIYETARGAGAIGGKLLGAGGGGFFLLFVPPARQQEVREKLSRLIHVPFSFESTGSRVVLYQPSGL
jgi:D-glycero-alpha-D-manno-heptose-7-phosphate kinase